MSPGYSKLNEESEPTVYLCPNNFLAAQTAAQAQQFGLKCVLAEPELPSEFLDSKAIQKPSSESSSKDA